MASRPLPPGRRGRGGRATPTVHLPDVKILSDTSSAPTNETATSSYVERLRAERTPTIVEPQHESTTTDEQIEPVPVRSVKAFVSSLEKPQEIAAPARAAAAAGEDASPVAPHKVVSSPPATAARIPVVTPEPAPVVRASTTPVWQPSVSPKPATVVTPAPTPIRQVVQPPVLHHAPPPVQAAVAVAAPALRPVLVAAAGATPFVNAAVPVLEGFHPFKLLLPVYAVPEIPETIDCVFDDAAVEMQKNIMKTVKKLFGKDRAKLEDFKINSRLYGNNFMDPVEYLDSLVKDLGGNRALMLVPCLVSIQPDYMKRSSMLVATRSYRLRNLARLEATLDKVAAVEAPVPVTLAAPVPTAAVVKEGKPKVEAEDIKPTAAAVSVSIVKDAKAEQATFAPIPLVKEVISKPVVAEVAISQPSPAVLVAAEPVKYTVSEPTAFAVVEPHLIQAVLMEPKPPVEVFQAPSHIVQSPPVAAPVTLEVSPTEVPTTNTKDKGKLDSADSFITVDTNVSSERSSLSSPTAAVPVVSPRRHLMRRKSTLTLFGEEIGDENDTDDEIKIPPTKAAVKASGLTSPTATFEPSLFDAGSLFGEIIPVVVKPMKESPAVAAPSALKSPPRTGMLFGFASAGGNDSDSDSNSEFSD